jgi:hypothetical protein
MPASTLAVIAAISVAAAIAPSPSRAGGAVLALPTPAPVLTINELIGQAKADECFVDIGVDYPPMNTDGTCPAGKPKTNESYVWGLTEQSGKLWFGTMANAACLLDGHDGAGPTVSNLFACEYGMSQYARTFPTIPDALGDWRPPSIYMFDLATNTLAERPMQDPLINKTLGFRGAGSIDNIAFLGGQSLAGTSANIFAFKADTGQYLGSCSRTDYNYIRKWQVVAGVLYVGVGSPTHGSVLRWDGNASSFSGNFCNAFTEVGRITANVANVTKYTGADGQDRLAVTTVPIRSDGGGSEAAAQRGKARADKRPGTKPGASAQPGTGAGVGLWISPKLGPDGLTSVDVANWRQVWSPLQYDPDRVVGQFGYSGGAVQYFDGWLYWGTIHVQNSGAIRVHKTCTEPNCFGVPTTPEEEAALEAGVYRTASMWRGRHLEDPRTREIQLLYGETELPACCEGPKTFTMKPTGWTPVYGPSGFGNVANEYIWQMAVFNNRLFVGTYDASIFQSIRIVGADLWRFDSSNSPAVNENFIGLGDPLNYGIRAMEPLDDGSGLVVGMANPFNLAVGGGWELRRLKEAPAP